MITTTFEDEKPIEFPKLMRGMDTGSIYIFSDRTTATLLHPGQADLRVGHVVTGNINMGHYEDFNGKITLQND